VAGKKLTRGAGKRLDAYGEKKVFDLYLKYRDVRKMLKNMPPEVGAMSNAPFYEWLKADPTQGRWNRWQNVKQVIASDLVEEGLTIVDEANDFLAGLKAVEARAKAKREKIAEADYEIIKEET
jgi:hypothetical protein